MAIENERDGNYGDTSRAYPPRQKYTPSAQAIGTSAEKWRGKWQPIGGGAVKSAWLALGTEHIEARPVLGFDASAQAPQSLAGLRHSCPGMHQ